MAVVKIFQTSRSKGDWLDLINGLSAKGMQIYDNYSPADVSIVIDGRFDNPTVLDGKKVLLHNTDLWHSQFGIHKTVLVHYYDDFIDATDLMTDQIIEKLGEYIEAQKS